MIILKFGENWVNVPICILNFVFLDVYENYWEFKLSYTPTDSLFYQKRH